MASANETQLFQATLSDAEGTHPVIFPDVEQAQHMSVVGEQEYVHLILYTDQETGQDLYLRIPLDVIKELNIRPVKYLRYLGWCILGGLGKLTNGKDIHNDSDDLELNGKRYYYSLDDSDKERGKLAMVSG